MHRTQTVVCTPHQYQYSGHDPHLWRYSKCHRKGTLGTCGGVPRSREVSLGLSEGPREECGPIREDWGRNGAEIGFGRRDWEGGNWG